MIMASVDRYRLARGQVTPVLLLALCVTVASLVCPGSCLEQGLTSLNDGCTCSGDRLLLTCTTVGPGVTVWMVQGCDDTLLPSGDFSDPGGIVRRPACSGQLQNMVEGRSLSFDGECYTSQFSLTAIPQLDNTNVVCQHDGTATTTVGTYTIELTSDPFPAPSDVSLTDISSNGLTFGWTSTAPNCSSVSYRVNATGCGNCPLSTNSTLVVCSDVGLTGENRSCDFQIQTVTCGDIVSSYSNVLTTVLQAAGSPMATVLPRYQQDTTQLLSFTVTFTQVDPVTISGYNVTAQSYVLSYRTNDVVCDSRTIESTDPACADGVCRTEFSLTTSSCTTAPAAADDVITLSISAVSVLGTGPPSVLTIDRSSSNFVRVLPDIADSSISCSFTNTQDTSVKTCSVSYGQCGSELSQTAQANSTASGDTNLVRVQLDVGDSASFCYVVTASSDAFSVQVEGSVAIATTISTMSTPEPTAEPGRGGLAGGAVAAIVIVIIILVAGINVVVTVIVLIFVQKRTKGREYSVEMPVDEEKELDTIATSHDYDVPPVSLEKESQLQEEKRDESVENQTDTTKMVENPSYSITAPLTVENTFSKLSAFSSKWQVIGESLSLSEAQLDEVTTNNETEEGCLREVLERYMKLTGVAHTWEEIGVALKQAEDLQKKEIEKRLRKHPDQVPVIIERHKGEETLKQMMKTLWIPKTLTIAQLGAAIRKPTHLDLRHEQSLYLNIGGKTVVSGTLDDLYTTHKHLDGYLHITYSSQQK